MKGRYWYKAKRVDNGEWICGSLITGVCYVRESGEDIPYILNADESDACCFEDYTEGGEYLEVDSNTICQCTGLKDKNGDLIWENDVVRCIDKINDMEFTAIVEFGNPNGFYSWGYQLKRIKGDKPNLNILLWIEMEEAGATCEVIGNRFDNPELLEV